MTENQVTFFQVHHKITKTQIHFVQYEANRPTCRARCPNISSGSQQTSPWTGLGLGSISVWPWAKNGICISKRINNNKEPYVASRLRWQCQALKRKCLQKAASHRCSVCTGQLQGRGHVHLFPQEHLNVWKTDLLMSFSRFLFITVSFLQYHQSSSCINVKVINRESYYKLINILLSYKYSMFLLNGVLHKTLPA